MTGKTHHSIQQVKDELKRWENMLNRRDPLTKVKLVQLALMIQSMLLFSLLYVLLDWLVLGIHFGFPLTEYAQKKNITSLRRITRNFDGPPKALIMEDFKFYANNRVYLSHKQAITSPDIVKSISIQFWQQKNDQNCKWKTIARNPGTPTINRVTTSIRIIERAQNLNHDKNSCCDFVPGSLSELF